MRHPEDSGRGVATAPSFCRRLGALNLRVACAWEGQELKVCRLPNRSSIVPTKEARLRVQRREREEEIRKDDAKKCSILRLVAWRKTSQAGLRNVPTFHAVSRFTSPCVHTTRVGERTSRSLLRLRTVFTR